MASIREDIITVASPDQAWEAIRDIGALHERLVPGFVVATRLEPGARVVTFANGLVVREPIVSIDDDQRRLVWTAEGGRTSHYNSAVQVLADRQGGSRIVWIVDFLPDAATQTIGNAMSVGADIMRATLDRQAGTLAS